MGRLAAFALAAVACGSDEGGHAVDAGPPPREVSAELTVDESGISEEMVFAVPARTRSVTVVVEGAKDALYALAELRTADGADQVKLPAGAPGPAMAASYEDEQIGQMPGELYQTIRLGTFTHLFPYRPDQSLPEGMSSLRVASDRPGPVSVTLVMPEETGARALHMNVVVVSDSVTVADPPGFAEEVAALFAQVDIDVVFDRVVTVAGSGLEVITDFSEPQERPDSMSAMLPGLVSDLGGAALDVFVVEALPAGVGGLSLGTPGPPLRGSYYYGVVVLPPVGDGEAARVVTHEVCHFMALQHVENRGISGAVYPDPLDDTAPGQGNLMEGGTTLTRDQAWSLQRSALLQAE